MNRTLKTIRAAVAAAAAFAGLGLSAATINIDANASVDELVVTEDTELVVASGATYTVKKLSGGDFKLVKTGAGGLTLATGTTPSTFTGSLYVSNGVFKVSGQEPFGPVNEAGTSKVYLHNGPTLGYANNSVVFDGQTSSKPIDVIIGVGSNTTFLQFSNTNEFKGAVHWLAGKGTCMPRFDAFSETTFAGGWTLDYAVQLLFYANANKADSAARVIVKDYPVVATNGAFSGRWYNGKSGEDINGDGGHLIFKVGGNKIKNLGDASHYTFAGCTIELDCADNIIDLDKGTSTTFSSSYHLGGSFIDVCGHDQTIMSLVSKVSDTKWGGLDSQSGFRNSGLTPGTIRVKQMSNATSALGCFDDVNFVKEGNKTLTFTNAAWQTTGSITVNLATLAFKDGASARQAHAVSVTSGATFSIEDGDTFGEQVELSVDGKLSFSAGVVTQTVATLTLGGVRQTPGLYEADGTRIVGGAVRALYRRICKGDFTVPAGETFVIDGETGVFDLTSITLGAGATLDVRDASVLPAHMLALALADATATVRIAAGETLSVASLSVAGARQPVVGTYRKGDLAFLDGDGAFAADAQPVDELYLSEDTTVTVPAGAELHVKTLAGGAYTLTKAGEGALVLGLITNADVNISVAAGTLATEMVENPADEIAKATLHLDANDLGTSTTVEENGTNFVTTWKSTVGSAAFTTAAGRPSPYVNRNYRNGLDVVDFGTQYNPDYPELNGYGAALSRSGYESYYQAFFVWADNEEDIQRPIPAGCDPSKGFKGGSFADLSNYGRGFGGNGEGFALASSGFARFTQGRFYMDGCLLQAGGSSDTFYATRAMTGLHVLELSNTTGTKYPADIGGIGGRDSAPYGGVRVGEILTVPTTTDADGNVVPTWDELALARIRGYLNAKWLGHQRIGTLTLAAGAKLALADSGLVAKNLNLEGDAELTQTGNARFGAEKMGTSDGRLKVSDGVFDVLAGIACVVPPVDFGAATDPQYRFDGSQSLDTLSGMETLNKTGSGVVRATLIDGGVRSVDVREGALAMRPLDVKGTASHFDASAAATLTLVAGDGGTNYVSKWSDLKGGSALNTVAADVKMDVDSTRTFPRPFLNAGFQNGLNVIDFGTYCGAANPSGYGAALDLKDASANNRDYFAVFADRPEVKDIQAADGKDFNGPAILGDTNNYWKRGTGGNGKGFKLYASNVRDQIANGPTCVDGTAVTPKGYVVPDGFHVFDGHVTDDSDEKAVGWFRYVGRFSKDWSGGVRLGEIITFPTTQPDWKRNAVRSELMGKWLNLASPIAGATYDTFAVRAGAAADYSRLTVEATNAVVAGTLVAQCLRPVGTLSLDGGRVDGELALADGVTLAADLTSETWAPLKASSASVLGGGRLRIRATDAMAVPGTRVKLIDGAVSGASVSGWKGTVEGVSAETRVKLVGAEDGLYAEFKAIGTLLIVR